MGPSCPSCPICPIWLICTGSVPCEEDGCCGGGCGRGGGGGAIVCERCGGSAAINVGSSLCCGWSSCCCCCCFRCSISFARSSSNCISLGSPDTNVYASYPSSSPLEFLRRCLFCLLASLPSVLSPVVAPAVATAVTPSSSLPRPNTHRFLDIAASLVLARCSSNCVPPSSRGSPYSSKSKARYSPF